MPFPTDQAPSNPIPEGFYPRLGNKIGIERLRSEADAAFAVEQRLPLTALESLTHGGVSDEEVYRLVIPRRTLAHRRANAEALTQDESDRAVRVARAVSLAEEVFGESDRALRWMRKPKHRFQGRSPMELLVTEAGARLVEELLYQVDHGMVA